jgi:hypothetical protein
MTTAIVPDIGAIDSIAVSTNPTADATAHTYSHYPLPAEITAAARPSTASPTPTP